MAQSRGQQRGGRPANQPWNVLYPRQYEMQGQHGGSAEPRTDFMRVGVAFPLRDRQGFSIELFIIPPVIDGRTRLVLMPRESDDPEQDGRR